jgi:hypothetical protein
VLVALALLHLLPFAVRPALIGGDEPHYALMAASIAGDGDFALDEDYRRVAAGSKAAGEKGAGKDLDRHLLAVGGRQVFSHPLGLPLLAAPLLALEQRLAPGAAPDLVLGLLSLTVTYLALLAGWQLLAELLGDPRAAALAAAGAYLASPLWFYSRTFFTEPYLWALPVLALYALRRERPVTAAVLLGLALAVKETAVVIVGPLLVASAVALGWRRAALLAAGPAVFGALFVGKNLVLTGRPLSTFQPYAVGEPLAGLAGLLVGWEKGLLGFAPLLLVGGLGGWIFGERSAGSRRALATAAVVFAAYLLLAAAWVDWRGGSSYGPRLVVPALPALALPLGQLAARARHHRVLRRLLAAAFGAGFTVAWCAALEPVAAFWATDLGQVLAASPVGLWSGPPLAAALWWGLWRWPG